MLSVHACLQASCFCATATGVGSSMSLFLCCLDVQAMATSHFRVGIGERCTRQSSAESVLCVS